MTVRLLASLFRGIEQSGIHSFKIFLSWDARPITGLRISPIAAGEDVPKGTPGRQRRGTGSLQLLASMPYRHMELQRPAEYHDEQLQGPGI